MAGDAHVVSFAPSREHSNASGSDEPALGVTAARPRRKPPAPKSNVADTMLVGVAGPELIVGAVGAVVSTVQLREAGVRSVLPLESVAATVNV